MAFGHIIACPAGNLYFESLTLGRHKRELGDSWRYPGDTD